MLIDIKSDMSRKDHIGYDFMSKEILNFLSILLQVMLVDIK